MYLQIKYLICMYKEDLALNNLQRLICHKTKLNHLFDNGKATWLYYLDIDYSMLVWFGLIAYQHSWVI